jgi:hypothetical protein
VSRVTRVLNGREIRRTRTRQGKVFIIFRPARPGNVAERLEMPLEEYLEQVQKSVAAPLAATQSVVVTTGRTESVPGPAAPGCLIAWILGLIIVGLVILLLR